VTVPHFSPCFLNNKNQQKKERNMAEEEIFARGSIRTLSKLALITVANNLTTIKVCSIPSCIIA
jgi:hypothetical protein